jgi:phosphate transport system permease protein
MDSPRSDDFVRGALAPSRRTRRLRRIDRAAMTIITLGGIGVVVAVLGILVFIVVQAAPLFRGASVAPAGVVRTAPLGLDPIAFRAFGVDEYLRFVSTVTADGQLVFHALDSGAPGPSLPIPERGEARVVSSSQSVLGGHVAAGLSDGRVALVQVRVLPQYEDSTLRDLAVDLRARGVVVLDDVRRPIRQVSYVEQDGQQFVAGVVDESTVKLWWTDAAGDPHLASLTVPVGERLSHVRLGRNGALIAGTDRGRVHHWELSPEPLVSGVVAVAPAPITALEWMLGGNSWVAAAEDASLSAWFRAPIDADGGLRLVRAHSFAPQSAPVVSLALSARERSFATVGRDGSVVVRHQTSEQTLAALPPNGPVTAALIAPKADALLVVAGDRVRRYTLDNPHPETSWRTLFAKVWYEGYAAPEYVWQSTAATTDVEPKFSLIPLIFGTLKGTLYAMLFAVPLGVLAALYTSQFCDTAVRAKIKPAVEIMAALPSVVIGFLAGLYLASVVERHLVAVLLMLPLLPIVGTSGVLLWRWLPARMTGRLRAGAELLLILPLLIAAAWLATQLGPSMEAAVFGGDARLWLSQVLGLTYDQRNCLVVGIAMGFAVIPIIFTISEDAFSSVPSSLTAASMALGASRWQTALHVVLPTASPGIFSAVMIGFGRAVGETMIVLMATGNTPIMDWSIFNGIRTLSANIAVEIPEAPYGSTLYRTLFLAAALLFAMTFLVNTIAEVIRQRLRERFRVA